MHDPASTPEKLDLPPEISCAGPKAIARGAPPSFAITSGKGGVGKTNIVANLAATLAARGIRVLVIDADLGLASLDLLLDVRPKYTFADFFYGRVALAELLTRSADGILLLPGANGVQGVTALGHDHKLALIAELDVLADDVDVVLIDTASGISDAVTYFASAAQHIVVVVTPEPLAMTDAYALIKILAAKHHEKQFQILVNNVAGEAEAQRVFDVLSRTALRYLNVSVDLFGWIPGDGRIAQSLARARMVVAESPEAPSAQAFARISEHLAALLGMESRVKGNLQFFFQRSLETARGTT
jgi:flagellar biosynthesis protein FlhG